MKRILLASALLLASVSLFAAKPLKVTAGSLDVLKDNVTATATIDLSILYKEQPLVATDFAWNRHGAAAVTGGIEEYGLQWTSNGKEIFAELKPMDGATLYEFDPSVWSATTNEVQKAALFSELPLSIPVFKKVSAWASNNYDFVIGTTYQGKNYLIHITEGIVSTFKGTDIVIKGQAK